MERTGHQLSRDGNGHGLQHSSMGLNALDYASGADHFCEENKFARARGGAAKAAKAAVGAATDHCGAEDQANLLV
jgi:hypothetical protein